MPAPASPFESEELQRPFEALPPTVVDQITAIPIQARHRRWLCCWGCLEAEHMTLQRSSELPPASLRTKVYNRHLNPGT